MGEHVARTEVHARQRCQLACKTLATAALIIGDHQLDAAQAAPRELAQVRAPKGLSVGRADIYAEHFAAAIAVDRNRNYD